MEGSMEIEEISLIQKLAKVQADIELAIEENNENIVFELNNSIMSNVFLELGISIDKDSWNALVEKNKNNNRK
jgi:hypothetical protein